MAGCICSCFLQATGGVNHDLDHPTPNQTHARLHNTNFNEWDPERFEEWRRRGEQALEMQEIQHQVEVHRENDTHIEEDQQAALGEDVPHAVRPQRQLHMPHVVMATIHRQGNLDHTDDQLATRGDLPQVVRPKKQLRMPDILKVHRKAKRYGENPGISIGADRVPLLQFEPHDHVDTQPKDSPAEVDEGNALGDAGQPNDHIVFPEDKLDDLIDDDNENDAMAAATDERANTGATDWKGQNNTGDDHTAAIRMRFDGSTDTNKNEADAKEDEMAAAADTDD